MAQDHLTIENNCPVRKIPTNGVSTQASIIESGPLRIVITDSPSNFTMDQHIRELVKLNVKHLCRACEPSYDITPLQSAKIDVHELAFPDGDAPTPLVLKDWLELIDNLFLKNGPDQLKPSERISVHCVAGLGRAPVLVAVALIEACHMEPLEAVQFIRKHRRGAINRKQLTWLEQYQPRYKQVSLAACGLASCFSFLVKGKKIDVKKE